jgi:putative transposase
MNEQLCTVIKRRHYPLSLRHIEEMMVERGVSVDRATVHRWSIKMLPVLAAIFRLRKRPVGGSWRMDETYILVSGQ